MWYKMMFLFLLGTASLYAMHEDPGIWDGHGRYLGPAYGCAIVYLPPGFRIVVEPIAQTAAHDDVATGDAHVSEITSIESVPDKINNQDNKPISASASSALPAQKSKKNWADDNSDDEPVSLPADWVPHAKPASSSSARSSANMSYAAVAAQGSHVSDGKPPRMLPRSNMVPSSVDHAGAHSHDNEPAPLRILKRSEIHTHQTEPTVAPHAVSADFAQRRKPISFDDELALAARNVRDDSREFMKLLSRKIRWFSYSCFERKITKESENIIHILEHDAKNFSATPDDVEFIFSLADMCVNRCIKRNLSKEGNQGYVDVATMLLYLTASSLKHSAQQQRFEELANKIESFKKRGRLC